jgi:hypothetical protein
MIYEREQLHLSAAIYIIHHGGQRSTLTKQKKKKKKKKIMEKTPKIEDANAKTTKKCM